MLLCSCEQETFNYQLYSLGNFTPKVVYLCQKFNFHLHYPEIHNPEDFDEEWVCPERAIIIS